MMCTICDQAFVPGEMVYYARHDGGYCPHETELHINCEGRDGTCSVCGSEIDGAGREHEYEPPSQALGG